VVELRHQGGIRGGRGDAHAERLIRWAVDRTCEMIRAAVLAAADADDAIDWTVPVDSTVVRAHQLFED
jgi:hypothetical protein